MCRRWTVGWRIEQQLQVVFAEDVGLAADERRQIGLQVALVADRQPPRMMTGNSPPGPQPPELLAFPAGLLAQIGDRAVHV